MPLPASCPHRLLLLLVTGIVMPSCRVPVLDPVEEIPGDTGPDASDAVFDPARVLQVDLVLEPTDWDALRTQTRDFWDTLGGDDCQSAPFDDPFTWFPAAVTLDGEELPDVAVRKKGFLGSLSSTKPALKIDFGEFGGTATWSGVERLTLNNALSDPSYVRQCLGYGFFRDAGMPASRCAFARVTVNGDDLGLYVNVEPVKKELIGRFFDDPGGNLYEGTLSDFREGWTGTLEKKSNEEEDDWSDIDALVAALEAPDDRLLETLEPLVDVDAFLTHQAAEVLTTHLDGYANNTNNFYLYHDPTSGRFYFLPWGIDEILRPPEELEGYPASVYASGILAWRLYGFPEIRDRYVTRLRALLAGPWNEVTLLERVDQMEALLLPEVGEEDARTLATAIDEVRSAVQGRRAAIEEEISDGPYPWTGGLRSSYCFEELGTVEATFETTWGSVSWADPFTFGTVDLQVTWGDDPWVLPAVGGVAGEDGGVPVLYLAGWLSPDEAVLLYFTTTEALWVPGSVDIDLGETVAALFTYDTRLDDDWVLAAYVTGSLTLESAGTTSGEPVKGTLDGNLFSWGM